MVEAANQNKGDIIKLTIPAMAEYVSVVRLTSSAIASRIGFDIEEIEDIKVAIAEACTMIIKNGEKQNIDINFEILADILNISVQAKYFVCQERDNKVFDVYDNKSLSILIIESLMDKVECESCDGIVCLKMMKKLRVDV
ncbi:serine/threonine-protein kinase RsbW [Caloranaerobacter azorensis DSM 13643]|uniref:Serine/threonine-protein kinase RsbW n=1 Tax=Caloranaerobacter azorensis DSM 13643 TaxID=1121264 RepID=A0A1M5VS41_9FIRM|nr:ATP-binding protein [Caloranaerobacter azorensis]SHH78076.1 serine/threonine-protein kinase RsbW [Caloranaerobacter azorensis DSM 13643]